jgi:hypothetical protein
MTEQELREVAYVELRDGGRFDEAGVALVEAVVRSVAGVHWGHSSYPTLAGAWRWEASDVAEAVNAFFIYVCERGRLSALAVKAADGATLEAGLTVRCRSWFQDMGKATNVGAFARKMKTALNRGVVEDLVVAQEVPDAPAWRRPMDPPEVFRGSDELLVVAAFGVEVSRLTYAGGDRRDPLTDWRGVLTVVLAALEAALGAVLERTLLRVGVRRFGIDARGDESFDRLTGQHEGGERAPDSYAHIEGLDLDPADSWLVEASASEILTAMDAAHIEILDAWYRGGMDAVMDTLGVKKSAASVRLADARDGLAVHLTGYQDREFALAVLGRVLARAERAHGRTSAIGSSSVAGGGGE